MHLTFVLARDVRSKAKIIKFLSAIERGQHLNLPYVHYVRVRAFRLEPLDARHTPFVVDGEVVETTSVLQASIADTRMRVVATTADECKY